ncbi:hypothetical protein RB653_008312 [Dictyostelium firmibasis]|uniref:UDENN domain-containing protein n=1 Tax=Dictyostelium firmibasis TaxID=79012 RepID=A0AAN7U4K3_9MYCE
MQSIPFVKSHRRTPSGRKQMDITIDVEALTNDEKLSRSLYTGVRRKSTGHIDRPRLFEWFIIIGVPPIEGSSTVGLSTSPTQIGISSLSSSTTSSSSSATTSPPLTSSKPPLLRSSSPNTTLSASLGSINSQSSSSTPPNLNTSSSSSSSTTPHQPTFNKTEQPKILYQYPPDRPLDGLSVEFFPFPNGVAVSSVSQTASHTNLFQVLYPQKHLKQPEDSFVFMLTDEKKDVLYGVCTTKISSIGTIIKGEKFEVDINDEPCPDESIPQVGDLVHTSPRCFCILTKYPFFPLHFDIISGVLSLQHMQEITKFQNLMSISSRKNRKPSVSSNSSPLQSTIQKPTPTIATSNNNNDIINTGVTTLTITDSNDNTTTLAKVSTPKTAASIEDPLINNSNFKVRDRPILELIEYFYNQPIPNIGETISYNISSLEQKITFKRGAKQTKQDSQMIDYGDYMLKYGLFTTVQMVQPKNLILLLNAILLEKKVLFYSKTIRSLTSVIFTVLSLLSPFNYQSVILPLLPNSVSSLSIVDLLSAPVPYIIGLTDVPKDVDYSDIVQYDIDTGKLQQGNQKIMLFPHWQDLLNVLTIAQKDIKSSLTVNKKGFSSPTTSFIPTEEQELKLQPFVSAINNHISGLFDNFKRHCVRNVTHQKTISVFVKESFMFTEYPEEEHHQWIDEFTKTLMFSMYLDQKLRIEDNDQLDEST